MREPAPVKLKDGGFDEGLELREEEPILAASRRSFTAVSWASNLGEGSGLVGFLLCKRYGDGMG